MAGSPFVVVPSTIVACWISLLYGPASYLTIVALILGLFSMASNRRWLAAVLIVTAHPVSVFFVLGALDYTLGRPHVLVREAPAQLLPVLDPYTRAELNPATNYFPWTGWVRPELHNAGVWSMTALFGVVDGAYDGPYPDKANAMADLGVSVDMPLDEFLTDIVSVGGRTTALRPGLGAAIFDGMGFRRPGSGATEHRPKLAGALVDDRCLIVHVRQWVDGNLLDVIVLIDANNGKAFACFSVGMPVSRPAFSYYDDSAR